MAQAYTNTLPPGLIILHSSDSALKRLTCDADRRILDESMKGHLSDKLLAATALMPTTDVERGARHYIRISEGDTGDDINQRVYLQVRITQKIIKSAHSTGQTVPLQPCAFTSKRDDSTCEITMKRAYRPAIQVSRITSSGDRRLTCSGAEKRKLRSQIALRSSIKKGDSTCCMRPVI